MASHPPRSCCYKGVTHEGEAKGEFTRVAGDFEAYVAHPSKIGGEEAWNGHGILLITDVIGHRFINAQLIADQLAANGYFVMAPDLFQEDPIPLNRPEGFNIQNWLKGEYNPKKTAHTPTEIDPVVEKSLADMRETYKCKKIGAMGYCIGAKYVVRHLHPDAGKIDAGYLAHPSFVENEEVSAIGGPLTIAAAELDSVFPPEKRRETEQLLAKVGVPWQINLYSGVQHGFAVRGDMNNPVVKYAKETAFLQAVQWFEEHLNKSGNNNPTMLGKGKL